MKNCCNCGYCFTDLSVNDIECDCPDITEDELQKHFTEDQPNCPHWIEQEQESKPLTVEQVKKMFEAIDNSN